MRRRRWAKPLLKSTLTVLAVLAVIVLIEIILKGFGGQAHPVAGWAVSKLERVFTPLGQWFVQAPDWAWISIVVIINIPSAIILTWALNVGGLGIKPRHWPCWFALWWVVLVCGQLYIVHWARQGPGI